MDRISVLPDHIIAQVLSFLETAEAVKTSIFPSRWRYLWKSVIHIRMCSHDFGPDKFSNLLEHVLRNCSSTNLLTFELDCPLPINISRLNAWISSIHSCRIEELMICANNSDDYLLPNAPLPLCILSYSTLVSLTLDCFDIQIPDSVGSFLRLKSLDLHVVFPNSESAANRLLSYCPVLEQLHLFGFLDSCKLLKIDISVSTLRKLEQCGKQL